MSQVQRAKRYIGHVIDEAKKVVWPTRQQLMEHSIVVIGALLVTLVIVAGIDYVLAYFVKRAILGV